MLFLNTQGRAAAGLLTALAGIAGVTCSASIYLVRARPAWFSRYTIAEFYSSVVLLGPLFVLLLDNSAPAWVRYVAVVGGAAQLGTQSLKFLWLTRSEVFELRGSALLLSGRFRDLFLLRLGTVAVGGILLPLLAPQGWPVAAAFALTLASEWLGRYLFFVSVVPKNIAAAFTSGERMAA
jgi:DMSO reductase anchor subunit